MTGPVSSETRVVRKYYVRAAGLVIGMPRPCLGLAHGPLWDPRQDVASSFPHSPYRPSAGVRLSNVRSAEPAIAGAPGEDPSVAGELFGASVVVID